jgi:hypothetical protein
MARLEPGQKAFLGIPKRRAERAIFPMRSGESMNLDILIDIPTHSR